MVQAHLQRFRVLEAFWCHGIIKNSHLFCLHSAVGSFPLGMLRQGSWQLLVLQAKSLHGSRWSALLSTPAAGTATLVFILGNFRAKPSVISTVLPASVGKMKSLSSYKYTGDPHITFAVFRSLRNESSDFFLDSTWLECNTFPPARSVIHSHSRCLLLLSCKSEGFLETQHIE